MADSMSSFEFSRNSQCSGPLPPSTPIQLRGFQTGDTIQVRGDTDEFNFSLHLNFQNRSFQFPQPSPGSNHHHHHHQVSHDSSSDNILDQEIPPAASLERRRSQVVTRLRSGALSSVAYFLPPQRRRRIRDHSSRNPRKRLMRKRSVLNQVGEEEDDLLERILRRRSLPLRPCNSYAFFVMAKWGELGKGKNTCSFADRSRELGKMWASLEEDQKKVFQGISLRDNARYKRQCILFKEPTGEDGQSQNSPSLPSQ